MDAFHALYGQDAAPKIKRIRCVPELIMLPVPLFTQVDNPGVGVNVSEINLTKV